MASDYETIRVEMTDEGIAHIILNRPRVLNAINSVMMREVNEVLDALDRDPAVRCFIVSGEGRAFSAGFDLKESAAAGERTVQDWRRVLEADFDFVIRFWDCRSRPSRRSMAIASAAGWNWRSPVTWPSPERMRSLASRKSALVQGSWRWYCPGWWRLNTRRTSC